MSYVVTDIETVADLHVWDPPPPKERKVKKGELTAPPGFEPAEDEKTPMPPIYACRPIVIGCAWLDENLLCKNIGAITEGGDPPELSEKNMLRSWSEFMKNGKKIVSWFGRGFDLPVLTSRAFMHGVPLTWYFDENYRYRYSEDKHIDLCDVLSNFGAVRGGIKLDGFSRLVGLKGKPGIDGSMVGRMYEDGRYDEIVAYCVTDVIGTALCFLRWKLIKGVDLDQYQAAVDSVFVAVDKWIAENKVTPEIVAWLADIDRKRAALRGPF